MTFWRPMFATMFGKQSNKVWRSVIGATWTLPLRFAVFAAQLAAYGLTPGSHAEKLLAGVAVGWAAAVVDRLVNEFGIYPAVRRFFVKGAP